MQNNHFLAAVKKAAKLANEALAFHKSHRIMQRIEAMITPKGSALSKIRIEQVL